MMRQFTPTNSLLDDQSVLVTGGTGSFGHAFVRFVLMNYKPKRVCVFSRDELKQHQMEQDFRDIGGDVLRFYLGDIRDEARLRMALRGIDVVVHAAALKHVSIAEYNPFECIKTNVVGAENIVRAAIDAGVKKVVALSTDKAVNPVNLYGASKLAADKIFIAANHFGAPSGTIFSIVRYGNVSGSRGSVVPKFKKLIAEGTKSLPITDERMTRFWITLDQGVNFVLSSMEFMKGGEIFVPKIPSVRIVDIAKALAPNLPIHNIGIMSSEKVHEVLVTEVDSRTMYDLGDRYMIDPAIAFWGREATVETHATKVPDSFVYSSHNNSEWLEGDALKSVVGV